MPSILHRLARVLAAAAIVIAVLSHGWLVNEGREMHGGLLSFDSGGELWGNAELVASARDNGSQNVSSLFAPAGQLTLCLGLLAAAFLLGTAISVARWTKRAAVASLTGALAVGIVFIVTKPTGPAFGIQPGWSAMLFVVATAAGAAFASRGSSERRTAEVT